MKQRILVVDDEPQIREMLSTYFANHGYDTAMASDSKETLQVVAKSKIDVVVLDIGLAEEDGLKLLEKLKVYFSWNDMAIAGRSLLDCSFHRLRLIRTLNRRNNITEPVL